MRLGPIPLLVVGNVNEPSVRADPMLIETFLQNLIAGQFVKITSRSVPAFRPNMPLSLEDITSTEEQSVAEDKNVEGKSPLEQALLNNGNALLEQFIPKRKLLPSFKFFE